MNPDYFIAASKFPYRHLLYNHIMNACLLVGNFWILQNDFPQQNSGASLNGPSQKRTTSLERTHTKAPIDFSMLLM